MINRVVFLDMDGVLCTRRAALALGAYGHIHTLDPIGIQFLNRLHEAAPYQLVISSSWRHIYPDTPVILKASGLTRPWCNPDWRTKDLWDHTRSSKNARPAEIDEWLSRHPEITDYIILDDDHFKWFPEQRDHLVQTDPEVGIGFEDMERCLHIFKTSWPQAIRLTTANPGEAERFHPGTSPD